MDLRDDIKKVASLTVVDDNAKFYKLPGMSQAAKDRKMNERKVRKPRNLNILEDTDTNDMDIISSKVKSTFDKFEVSAAVREVNGGRDLSNKHWEDMLARNLEVMTKSEKEMSRNCSKHDNIRANQETKDSNINNKCIKARLYRNAAIMGLVKTKKITLQDLISSNENTAKNESETLHGTTFNKCITDECQVEAVPLREDPEIFVHPLQMGIDEKNTDFTITRIGKKKKTTPLEYFLEETDESHFDFVKPRDSTT